MPIMQEPAELPLKIGPYQVIKSLGKGGMGEVFLVKDPVCGRLLALKKIRTEMVGNQTIHNRFLKEAKIAALLTHPGIMPIYTLQLEEEGPLFYTMPYVEGQTLRQIIKECVAQGREGLIEHPLGSSIPSLVRIFFSVCEAIAYCHAKKVLHRDLKLDNIMIGKYGEVLILDWGLAHVMEEDLLLSEEEPNVSMPHNLTKPGKIAGTLSYLAPERLSHAPPSYQTDIYALGVILYQLLTLKNPFYRPSIQVFRKKVKTEKLHDLHEVAPYRNIPPHLAEITKKCLQPNPDLRYSSVESLLKDLKNYIEGKPEWVSSSKLSMTRKADWEFQENISLSKRMALSGALESIEWVSLMISKTSFSENIRLKATFSIEETGSGIGFLIGVPGKEERGSFQDGYCLWVGSAQKPLCKLFRSNVEVMEISDCSLAPSQEHQLILEKMTNRLKVYLDGKLVCHYLSNLPLGGGHVGLVFKDEDFTLSSLEVFLGSRDVTVSCLAIPDAFLASKNYQKARIEYHKIQSAFPGRKEAEEAIFRAGISFLEEAKLQSASEKKRLSSLSLEEFSSLRETPGAPLEYLGKALVYAFLEDPQEEMKCLELGLRKYPKHPLIKALHEHIIFRLHETAANNRLATFHYALMTLRYLPQALSSEEGALLLKALKKQLKPLFIFTQQDSDVHFTDLAIQLAFYLGKPLVLIDFFENSELPDFLKANICFALLFLGYKKWVQSHYDLINDPQEKALIKIALNEETDHPLLKENTPKAQRAACYLIDQALKQRSFKKILPLAESLQDTTLLTFSFLIKTLLLNRKWSAAKKLLLQLSTPTDSPLFPLMGAWILHSQGKKAALQFFSQNPSSSYLAVDIPLFFSERKKKFPATWHAHTPFYEKIELLHYLQILYECDQKPTEAKRHSRQIKREIQRVRNQNAYS